jgi:hypothetical protein
MSTGLGCLLMVKKWLTQGRVLTALHKGGVIRVEHIPGSGTMYRVHPGDGRVRPDLVEHLLALGLI